MKKLLIHGRGGKASSGGGDGDFYVNYRMSYGEPEGQLLKDDPDVNYDDSYFYEGDPIELWISGDGLSNGFYIIGTYKDGDVFSNFALNTKQYFSNAVEIEEVKQAYIELGTCVYGAGQLYADVYDSSNNLLGKVYYFYVSPDEPVDYEFVSWVEDYYGSNKTYLSNTQTGSTYTYKSSRGMFAATYGSTVPTMKVLSSTVSSIAAGTTYTGTKFDDYGDYITYQFNLGNVTSGNVIAEFSPADEDYKYLKIVFST